MQLSRCAWWLRESFTGIVTLETGKIVIKKLHLIIEKMEKKEHDKRSLSRMAMSLVELIIGIFCW